MRKNVRHQGMQFSSLITPHYPSAAFDRMVARGGLNGGAVGTPLRPQIDTVILAMTRKCNLGCRYCYERHNINGNNVVPVARWKEVVSQVQQIGASIIVLSGGEPMADYEALLELLQAADKDLSDMHLHTSGQGVTLERARQLASAGLMAAAVGLDDVDPDRHDAIRGHAGAHNEAVKALQAFNQAGVLTYVNLCLSPGLIQSGDLWKYYEFVKHLNVAFVQMLEPRPCGGYLSAGEEAFLTPEDKAQATEFFIASNARRRFRNYPAVHYVAYAESPANLGCRMAGLSHLYIDSMGNVNPCVFLPVTFGNIRGEDFSEIYQRMRNVITRPIYQECPSVALAETLRTHERAGQPVPVAFELIRPRWEELIRGTDVRSGADHSSSQ